MKEVEDQRPPSIRYLYTVEDEKTVKIHNFSTVRSLTKEELSGKVREMIITDKVCIFLFRLFFAHVTIVANH